MTVNREMLVNKFLIFLTALLLFANCASKQEEKTAPANHAVANNAVANHAVSGTVTINGKAENLSHVYARRMVWTSSISSGKLEYFALVFTNKPVPEAEMSKLLKGFAGNVWEQDFLQDKSISGVVFIVDKVKSLNFEQRYEGQVIHDGRSYISTGNFNEFSMQKGRMRGKTSRADRSGGEIKVTPDKGKPFTFKYAVEFEATPQGEPLNKEWEGAVSSDLPYLLSEPGRAEGAVTVDGKTVNLKYAYALRKREFFDEPEETIKILATDKPVAEDVLLKFLYTGGYNPKEGKVQGLLLTISPDNDKRLDVPILHQSADDGYINTNSAIEGLSITGERVTAKATEAGTQSGKNWNYSVSVDLPFKR
jgi:hypothetical protein